MEYINLYKKLEIVVSVIANSFLLYVFLDCSEEEFYLHTQQISLSFNKALRVMYNVQLNDKSENN